MRHFSATATDVGAQGRLLSLIKRMLPKNERDSRDGLFKKDECLAAHQSMYNGKTPRSDIS